MVATFNLKATPKNTTNHHASLRDDQISKVLRHLRTEVHKQGRKLYLNWATKSIDL